MESLVDALGRFAIDILNSTDGEWKIFYGSLTGAVVIEVLIDAVLWFVTRTILVKSLNLPYGCTAAETAFLGEVVRVHILNPHDFFSKHRSRSRLGTVSHT